MRDDADRQAEEVVDGPHPLRVAPGEVVVDGDDVGAPARQPVEDRRQGRDEASCPRRSASRRSGPGGATIAPISWTSKWRMPSVRCIASRPAAKTSGIRSSRTACSRSLSRLRRALARSLRRSRSWWWSSSSDGSSGAASSRDLGADGVDPLADLVVGQGVELGLELVGAVDQGLDPATARGRWYRRIVRESAWPAEYRVACADPPADAIGPRISRSVRASDTGSTTKPLPLSTTHAGRRHRPPPAPDAAPTIIGLPTIDVLRSTCRHRPPWRRWGTAPPSARPRRTRGPFPARGRRTRSATRCIVAPGRRRAARGSRRVRPWRGLVTAVPGSRPVPGHDGCRRCVGEVLAAVAGDDDRERDQPERQPERDRPRTSRSGSSPGWRARGSLPPLSDAPQRGERSWLCQFSSVTARGSRPPLPSGRWSCRLMGLRWCRSGAGRGGHR